MFTNAVLLFFAQSSKGNTWRASVPTYTVRYIYQIYSLQLTIDLNVVHAVILANQVSKTTE